MCGEVGAWFGRDAGREYASSSDHVAALWCILLFAHRVALRVQQRIHKSHGRRFQWGVVEQWRVVLERNGELVLFVR